MRPPIASEAHRRARSLWTQKGVFKMQDVTYELKYCERCGSLGLRRSQSGQSYCESCAQILNSYSIPGDRSRRPLHPKAESPAGTPLKLDVEAQSASPCGRLQ